ETAAPIPRIERAFDNLAEKGAHRLLWRQRRLEPGNALARRPFRIVLERLAEQRTLITERIVKAGASDPHARRQIAPRARCVPVPPEAIDCGIERGLFIDLTRSRNRRPS